MKSVNSDVAYDHIRSQILGGSYAPGHALMTESLAEEIGVSRTPVRDALRKLEADGLVVIQPRLGARVRKFEANEFREMCELRLALEAQTAGLAAKNRTAVDLHEIEAPLIAMRQLTAELETVRPRVPKINKLMLEDVRFHIAIISAAKNELMKKEILRLHLIHRVTQTSVGQNILGSDTREAQVANGSRVLAEHEAIYAAIAKGDAKAAKFAMEQHIENLIEISLRRIAQQERERFARSLTADELVYTA
tara:strand:- start:8080 stop:8829 length:750 start_codon:yes stop_codon:yes gene_type:complete